MKLNVRKIVCGGQTGADRAALDFALENNYEIGGWIPKNRLAEDGTIPENYPNLRETTSENSAERTELNVRDSDATLIYSHGELTGGSKFTLEICEKYQKPHFHVDFENVDETEAVEKTRELLVSNDCRILNVAGSRHSEDSQIYEKTKSFLGKLFS